MEILKGLKEQTLDRLSATHGEELNLTANLTSGRQMKYIMQSHAHQYLGSAYVRDRCELLQRLTCSYNGRHRTDLVDVGKSGGKDDLFGGTE